MARNIILLLLRVGELAFAAVVLGLTAEYLHLVRGQNSGDYSKARMIYTVVVAAISVLLALLWLLPFTAAVIHWPVDLVLFIAWIIAFGLLIDFIGPLNCGSIFYWGDITQQGICQKWKADVAFTFLSAIFWLASAILGFYYIRRARRTGHTKAVAGDGVGSNARIGRRRWFRSGV